MVDPHTADPVVMPYESQLAIEELKNIINAQRFDRDSFANDTEFAEWAISRCRYTLGLIERSAVETSPTRCVCNVPGRAIDGDKCLRCGLPVSQQAETGDARVKRLAEAAGIGYTDKKFL
jgi:hypothetical protein